jgi:hypothetical protein
MKVHHRDNPSDCRNQQGFFSPDATNGNKKYCLMSLTGLKWEVGEGDGRNWL